jgi:hypothetical protein
MPEWEVHFERRVDGENRIGKAPVTAQSAEAAEEQFKDDVLLGDGEFIVFDVQRPI